MISNNVVTMTPSRLSLCCNECRCQAATWPSKSHKNCKEMCVKCSRTRVLTWFGHTLFIPEAILGAPELDQSNARTTDWPPGLYWHGDGADAAAAGHDVAGCDSDLYERCTYDAGGKIVTGPGAAQGHSRCRRRDLEGFDAVIHLAALSNDPLGDLNPEVTYSINHQGSVRLAKAAKQAGVSRFLMASSCSNYGRAGEDMIDETGALNPVTAYGQTKVLVGARYRAARRRRLLPGLSAAGDRLWRLAAHAFRHRAQQSRRLGRHQGARST